MSRLVIKNLLLLSALAVTLQTGCKTSVKPCETSKDCLLGTTCEVETGECVGKATESDAGSRSDAEKEPTACPADSHLCVAAPEGWQGPVIGMGEAVDADPAGCEEGFEEAMVAKAEFEATGECSCSCEGNATGVVCGNASVTGFSYEFSSGLTPYGNCLYLPTDARSVSIDVNGVCAELNPLYGRYGVHGRKIHLPSVFEPGSCAAPVELNTLASKFHKKESFCSLQGIGAGLCPEQGQACLPKQEEEDSHAGICVYKMGGHECPEGFPARSVKYDSIEDSRGCSECSCTGAKVGETCGGDVVINSVPCSISYRRGKEIITSNTCEMQGGDGFDFRIKSAIYRPPATPIPHSCEAGKEGGEPSGEASPTGLMTICCME